VPGFEVNIIHLIGRTNTRAPPVSAPFAGVRLRSRGRPRALLVALSTLAASCTLPGGAPAGPAAPDAGRDGGAAEGSSFDAGPPPEGLASTATSAVAAAPLALPPTSLLAIGPSGGSPLALAEVSSVDPEATFLVRIRARLPEARLVLLDSQDVIVASRGDTEVGAETVFRLAPTEPLRPGSTYRLLLEGLAARELRDADGKSYAPLALRLRAAGEPAPAPARGKSHRRRAPPAK